MSEVKVRVEIPKAYLLILATYGTMGEGEVGKAMQVWAQKWVVAAGFEDELRELQKARLEELRQRMINVLGPEAVQKIESEITSAAVLIQAAERRARNP